MSVERSHAATGPKAVASAESAGGKGKVKSGDPVDALAEGGFSAILTSLEPQADTSVDANAVAETETNAVVDAPLTPQDVLQPTVFPPAVPPAVLPDSAVALPPSLPSELAMLLSQAVVVNGDKLSSASAASTAADSSEKLLGGTRSGVQQITNAVRADKAEPAMAKLPPSTLGARVEVAPAGVVNGDKLSSAGAASTAADSSEKLLVGERGVAHQGINAAKADKTEPATAKLTVATPGTTGEITADIQQNTKALLDKLVQTPQGTHHKANGGDLKSGAAAVLAESKALNPSFQSDVAAREPALSASLLTSGLGDGFLRQADRTVSRSAVQPGGSGLEGIWGQSAFQVNNRVDVPTVVIDPSMQSFESTVADTVSYWATNGVQNAELKLDGFDGESIAVSISLKGDETHIGFRTDKPETRQLLEGAVAHLKDLLTSEGLVLSGVSVGSSGQGRSGAQEQQNQPGARQATLVRLESEPAEGIQRVNRPTGSALDLFV